MADVLCSLKVHRGSLGYEIILALAAWPRGFHSPSPIRSLPILQGFGHSQSFHLHQPQPEGFNHINHTGGRVWPRTVNNLGKTRKAELGAVSWILHNQISYFLTVKDFLKGLKPKSAQTQHCWVLGSVIQSNPTWSHFAEEWKQDHFAGLNHTISSLFVIIAVK